jgi:cytoplasmic iron level regulating protein YaaA (DUF328/UPF0246 family)
MDYQKSTYLQDKNILFPKKTKQILTLLRKLTKEDIKKAYKIKDNLLEQTYHDIKNYSKNDYFHAFSSFTGLVYFNIDKDSYQKEEYEYIQEHVRILDALYGVLEPGTLIKPYRLDMKTKLGINLYQHWDLNPYFQDELIINLASKEFSQMIQNKIDILFFDEVKGTFKQQATYSKMARGKCIDFMIQNKVKTIEELKAFNLDGYRFNESLSNQTTIAFSRKK